MQRGMSLSYSKPYTLSDTVRVSVERQQLSVVDRRVVW